MVKHIPTFRELVQPRLGVDMNGKTFKKIVITEYETRGLDGRGGFFDGVGQVRDMVQSHLLQVLSLGLAEPAPGEDLSAAKLRILESISIDACRLGQYDGFLFEPKL